MKVKERLINTFKLLGYTLSELDGMKPFFEGQNLNNQFYRRILLKNFFAVIETYLYISREMVLVKSLIDRDNDGLSWEEMSLLNQKKAGLNAKGEVIATDTYQNFIPSFRFSLSIFAKAFDSEMPDFSDIRFNHLQKMIKRRNDLTHPKSHQDISITDEEIKMLIPMFGWFINLHGKIDIGFKIWLEKIWPDL
ncbi:hypothetical protein [Pedobacter zeae]|uniref:RiboL-PSP-HEPN domain-containing protein n=1 Tax=Pedobacter zeae TaxID=1737356 RepID=A0A7W6P6X6_9SPHI|nr:hypothetical protein [Pedobacter zeae]MBB4108354.1 hypothetical protein [Pedobacter zeae]GGG93354.1 hypothetical protein GCM10007422_03190 [Pedobacter zeae]